MRLYIMINNKVSLVVVVREKFYYSEKEIKKKKKIDIQQIHEHCGHAILKPSVNTYCTQTPI